MLVSIFHPLDNGMPVLFDPYRSTLCGYRVRSAPAVPYGAPVNNINGKPPLPNFLPQPSSTYSRYTNQLSTPEAASYREEYREWNHRPYSTSYHDAVRFSGGGRGSHKATSAHLEASDFHSALYGSAGDIGSIKGLQLDVTQTSHGGDTRMDGSVCRCGTLSLCCLHVELIDNVNCVNCASLLQHESHQSCCNLWCFR